jgi:hypothetical protein
VMALSMGVKVMWGVVGMIRGWCVVDVGWCAGDKGVL